jgi:hypothetical protein
LRGKQVVPWSGSCLTILLTWTVSVTAFAFESAPSIGRASRDPLDGRQWVAEDRQAVDHKPSWILGGWEAVDGRTGSVDGVTHVEFEQDGVGLKWKMSRRGWLSGVQTTLEASGSINRRSESGLELVGKYNSSNPISMVGQTVRCFLVRDGEALRGYEITGDGTRVSIVLKSVPTTAEGATRGLQPGTRTGTDHPTTAIVALLTAAREGRQADTAKLLSGGHSVRAQGEGGETALHWAAAYGRSGIVQLLLSKGADVNAKDAGGAAPLHYAAEEGQMEAVRLLLANGADPNAEDDNGMTPLHLAAGGGYSHVVNLLLARRARINTEDNGGSTPLHLAGAFGKQDTVKVLLKAGADGNARDRDGNTAADVARANDHAGLATLIESLGAKR